MLANLKNFSPDRRVRGDKRSKRAHDNMVRRERKTLVAERTPGYRVDETEGGMTKLAKLGMLSSRIARFHTICLNWQMKTCNTVTTTGEMGHGP